MALKQSLIAQRLNCKRQIKTVELHSREHEAQKWLKPVTHLLQGCCGSDRGLVPREKEESAAQSPTQAPWLGQNHCHERPAKGTGAAVETGSVSLYGLSLSFHPTPTATRTGWVSKPFGSVSVFSTRRPASEAPSSGLLGCTQMVSGNLTVLWNFSQMSD